MCAPNHLSPHKFWRWLLAGKRYSSKLEPLEAQQIHREFAPSKDRNWHKHCCKVASTVAQLPGLSLSTDSKTNSLVICIAQRPCIQTSWAHSPLVVLHSSELSSLGTNLRSAVGLNTVIWLSWNTNPQKNNSVKRTSCTAHPKDFGSGSEEYPPQCRQDCWMNKAILYIWEGFLSRSVLQI